MMWAGRARAGRTGYPPWKDSLHTDKKETQIFLIYKEIQNEAVAKSYRAKGLLAYVGKYSRISFFISAARLDRPKVAPWGIGFGKIIYVFSWSSKF